MTENKVPILRNVILAFLIATFLFLLIFSLSSAILYMNQSSVQVNNDAVSEALVEMRANLNNFSCGDKLLEESSRYLDDSGQRITLLEKRFGMDDLRVLEMKDIYFELEYEHFQLVKRFNEECNYNYKILLFFYINNEENIDASDRVSRILGSFKSRNPSGVMVYSFDYSSGSSVVTDLKKEYGVSFIPSVVVDGKAIYVNNIDDLGSV